MENASKALIMAGEILIAMLVVGLIVYAISSFGNFSKEMNADIEHNRTIEFNNHFMQFDGKADITADDIVSAINFAKHSNDSYDLYLQNGYSENQKSQYFVDVYVKGSSFFQGIANQQDLDNKINNFLKDYNNKYFMCNLKSIKSSGTNDDGQTIIKRVIKDNITYKNSSDDIIIDSSNGGTGKVIIIKFVETKTNGISNFDPAHRDEFVIQ